MAVVEQRTDGAGSCTEVALDPWTVYGALVDPRGTGRSVAVEVPDIGVLPPPGLYGGSVNVPAGPVSVRLTVSPRDPSRTDGRRGVTVELLSSEPHVLTSPVPLIFQTVVLFL